MAGVSLHWMMERAQYHGLKFNADAMEQARKSSHVHGRMYNSRDGFAIFYRYHPREIEKLCQVDNGQSKLLAPIKVHRSVIDRINHRTANYAPGMLPAEFDVVEDEVSAKPERYHPGESTDWEKIREKINCLVGYRKVLYDIFMSTVLVIVGFAVYLWFSPPAEWGRTGFWGTLADTLDYLTPDMFDGLIEVAIVQFPALFVTAVMLLIVYAKLRSILYRKTVTACEALRHIVIEHKLQKDGDKGGEDD